MTTIAVRGRVMAADSQANAGGCMATHKKIFRVGEALIGGSGNWTDIVAFVRWYEAGADMENLPTFKQYRGADDAPDFVALVLTAGEGESTYLEQWSEHFQPYQIEDAFYAIGSGSMAAQAAMVMGAHASQAVSVAIEVDINSGGDVQTETLEGETR